MPHHVIPSVTHLILVSGAISEVGAEKRDNIFLQCKNVIMIHDRHTVLGALHYYGRLLMEIFSEQNHKRTISTSKAITVP